MSAFTQEIVDAVERARSAGGVGGIALAARVGDEAPRTLFIGGDEHDASLDAQSLFPVASVTKLATSLAVARLVDQGVLSYDDALFEHLPEAASALPGIGLRDILSHCAGLPADLDPASAPYALGLDWPALRDACLQTPLVAAPRSIVQYGNVGYGLMAIVVERLTGLQFADALRSLVIEPLGIEAYLQADLPRPAVHLSDVRGRRAQEGMEPFNSTFYRSLMLPWAGLVTTLDGALGIIDAWSQPGFLQESTRRDATSNQVGDLGGGQIRPLWWQHCPWGLGPEIHGSKTPHWVPPSASASSFGHAGASGSLVWSDPEARVTWAIMGTRTADNGWLIRYGSQIGAALLQSAHSSATTE